MNLQERNRAGAAGWDQAVKRLQWHLYEREIEPHRAEVYRRCLRLTQSQAAAEDLVQETLLRGFRVVAQLSRGVDKPAAFLTTVAKNLWTDWQRRPEPIPLDVGELPCRRQPACRSRQLDEGLHRAREVLTKAELRAFIMRDLLQFTSVETAERLGTTNAAVKMAVLRARRRLRAAACSG